MRYGVRRAGADEWESYRALRMEMLRDSPKAFDTSVDVAAQWTEQRWQQAMASRLLDDSCWFVAVDDTGRWFGQAQGRRLRDRCYVLEVYVSPSWRGRHIAGELVEAVAGWAQQCGHEHLWLDVADGQDHAHRLYARLGFTATGVTGTNAVDPAVVERELVRALSPVVP